LQLARIDTRKLARGIGIMVGFRDSALLNWRSLLTVKLTML
jgi:hypothetical protein